MGNKDSRHKADYGTMHLELNKGIYTAGDMIEGSIHLQIDKKYPARVVYLEIIGTEKSKWVSNEGKGTKRH